MRPGGHSRMDAPTIEKGDTKETLKKVGGLLARYKIALIVVLVLAILSTVLSTLAPYLLGLATNEIVKGIASYKQGLGGVDMEAMRRILVVLLTSYLGTNLFGFLQQFILSGVSQKIVYQLRKDIQSKLNVLPLNYFDTNTLGDILSRVTNDVETVTSSLQQGLPRLFESVLTLILVFIGMLGVSPTLTLVAMVTLPLSAYLSIQVMKRSQGFFRGQQQGLGEIGGYIEEMYSGHEVIRAYNQEEHVTSEFSEINDRLYNNARLAQFASGLVMPLSGFFNNLGYVASAVLGGFMVIKGRIQVGSIQTFIQYLRQFAQPISQLSNMINELQATVAAAERVFEFLEEEEEPTDPENYKVIEDPQGQVSMEHVRFGYTPKHVLISDLSVDFKSGDKVAIVGPTGAGKTTLVNLLMRFYDTQGGSIKIDGVDIRDMRRSDLRSLFGMVLQDTWLFHGTVEENIRYGRLDATDEEVREAAKNAFVDEFIRSQPGGYQMMIDEDGGNISGGQRQLLTIARAILSDPTILILDEATSSVDTRTELLIQKAMENLMENRTSFVIAHRLSTIRDSEMILVLDQGDIVETGTHDELLEKDGFYAGLYRSQLAGNDI